MAFAGSRNECHRLSELKLQVLHPSLSLPLFLSSYLGVNSENRKMMVHHDLIYKVLLLELKFSSFLFNYLFCFVWFGFLFVLFASSVPMD